MFQIFFFFNIEDVKNVELTTSHIAKRNSIVVFDLSIAIPIAMQNF